MRRILLFMLLILFPSVVFARNSSGCDYKLFANLKKLASNVNISYTYKIVDDVAYFDVTLSNIQNDMYFIDSFSGNIYYYNNTSNGEITIRDYPSGNYVYTFFSNNSDCFDEVLVKKRINLPYYNPYYKYDECYGNENYKLCQRWTKYDGSYFDFLNSVKKYETYNYDDYEYIDNNSNFFDSIVNFVVKYYYIIFPLTILFVIAIMYFIKYFKNKLNRFDI